MIKRNEVLPTDRRELESMPFMGQYMANAVELLLYDKPFPLLDVNMSRVLERYIGERTMADIRYDPYLQKLAFKVVKHNHSKELNWAILDFAAITCKARNPICKTCFLARKCAFIKSVRRRLL